MSAESASAAHAADGHVAFPIVVAAPSGTGKTTVCREVVARDPGIAFSVSHTTRPRRAAERDGEDYHFVSEAQFRRLVAESAFLEHAVYNGHRYGTSWASIDAPLAAGMDVLLEIEVQGARQVRQRRADARFIFLLPPSFEVLRERLTQRGTDAPEQIERRLELARRELGAIGDFAYAVVNEALEACVRNVLEILAAERRGEVATVRQRFAAARALERLQAAG
ncbi:MAG: guanylate kinase [Myxococcales bacterium]|nr:guanylate kinase [Myxococcales bacterium]MDH5306647.1 guanylate kinase [Myxococcales bacterium]MDH5566737.1 guanylate kinase [Myxococcales bacterium]